jgi:dual specificity protein phosphatase-like protein
VDWITENVAVGTRGEVRDPQILRGGGFRSALSLDGTLSPEMAVDLGLVEIVAVPLKDGSGNKLADFRRAVDSLARLVEAHRLVFVHCEYGKSRSAAVVAGYLMRAMNFDPLQARAFVASKREISMSAALLPLLFQL